MLHSQKNFPLKRFLYVIQLALHIRGRGRKSQIIVLAFLKVQNFSLNNHYLLAAPIIFQF